MRLIPILFFIAFLSGCTSIPNAKPERWATGADERGNKRALYLDKGNASWEVYFSNRRSSGKPTTCIQSGSYTQDDNSLIFEFEKGSCDNGRNMNPTAFTCKSKDQKLRCSSRKYKQIVIYEKEEI